MSMRSTILASAALAALALCSTASAAVLAYDGFDAAAPGVFPAANNTNTGIAVGTSLSYGGLETTGGARQGGESAYLKMSMPEVNSGTVWMSWLFKSDKNAWNRAVTYNGTQSWGSGFEKYNLGFIGDGFAVRTLWSSVETTAKWSTSVDPATTYMLVAKYDFGTAGFDNGRISLWVNPNLSSLGNGSDPVGPNFVELTGITDVNKAAHMAFTGVAFHGIDGGAITLHDEFRVGQTWIDVSPVPEPAALGLLGVSAVLGLRRRSR